MLGSLHVTGMDTFWGICFFLRLEDVILYCMLWITLILSLLVFIMTLWKWKVGVWAGADPGFATQGGGMLGARAIPRAGLGALTGRRGRV